MALVMLPCELPWWSTVNRKLAAIQKTDDFEEILEHIQGIHDLCNVSLDPDEETRDPKVLYGLRDFVNNDLNECDRNLFIRTTVKNIAKRAQALKSLKPPRGLCFSLQQQSESEELDRYFVASLIANAFFSTFPRRTEKTHPTLQDFNFSNFFRSLSSHSQKAKFRCFLQYFTWLESQKTFQDRLKISRKVMTGKHWLTIEDWLECAVPLCPMTVKHQGRVENAFEGSVQTVFSTNRIGGQALSYGNSQECIQLFTMPEALVALLFNESLEDNEAILIEGAYQIARIMDPKNKAILDMMSEPRKVSLCYIDAENYSTLPVHQFEEDNMLRELNKCLLGFRQNTTCSSMDRREKRCNMKDINGRLSPIGESGSCSPKEVSTTIVIKQPSTSPQMSQSDSYQMEKDVEKRRSWLTPDPSGQMSRGPIFVGPTASGRRGRFIVLGSSGERLPVNRSQLAHRGSSSLYSSCDSEDDEFHSAKGSFEESDDDDNVNKKYELDTPEKRQTFAQRLREALRQSSNYTDSTESSYAVGISISGSQDCDDAIRVRRGGSTGFVLTEDSLDEEFFNESLAQEKQWLEKFRSKPQNVAPVKETTDSSKYSFDTELSSELEELYEQFSKWCDDAELKNPVKELDPRDKAVLNFANSLLKRTLSESFAGVSLADGCASSIDQDACGKDLKDKSNKLNTRSLSLELTKYKHRLAAQLKDNENKMANHHATNSDSLSQVEQSKPRKNSLKKTERKSISWSVSCTQSLNCDDVTLKISQLGQRHNKRHNSSLYPVATGNWGCGSSRKGDVQLKLVIQWMAASLAGLPVLVYYTSGHQKLTKLDTVVRVLVDRKWTVGELAMATLENAKEILDNTDNRWYDSQCFFEKLIGI